MKITILNDNHTLGNQFCCEHGLAVHVEMDGKALLLDTGQTDKYVRNALTLGISLDTIDAIVLSHGHYDHAGGLTFFPQTNRKIRLYMGPHATRMRYSLSTAMLKPNGFPHPESLDRFNAITVNGKMVIDEHITLFTLPHDAPVNDKLVTDGTQGSRIADVFEDEVFTFINYKGKRILFGGCTHHGLEQLLTYCKEQLDIKKIDLFVGGLHLSGRDVDFIKHEAEKIRDIMPVGRWIVNHCTGDTAIGIWSEQFGCIAKEGYSGSQIDL